MADPKGLAAHLARMRRVGGPGLAAVTAGVVERGAAAVAATARELAGDGTLAAGIVVVATGPGSAEVRSTAPQAVAMEYGTSRGPGRPHLRPAAAQERDAIAKDATRTVRALMRGG